MCICSCSSGPGSVVSRIALLALAGAALTAGVMNFRGNDANADDKQPAIAPAPAPPPATIPAIKIEPPKAQPAVTSEPPKAQPAKPAVDPYVLGFTMKDIDGNDVGLEQYKGKVALIVNVASDCGFTYQYEGLQKLFLAKREAGLVVLGFPANDFGKQEPGTNAQIKSFCTSKYNVGFPMFAKVSVKGSEQCELYKKLAAQPAPIGGDPGWNFTKFLVDRSGNVVARYDSRIKPDDATLNAKIEELLSAK